MAKKYDVVAIVGKYIDQSGQEKARFENVGAVIVNQNGGFNLLLKKTFNPAGLADPNKESIILSLVEPRQNDGQQQGQRQQTQPSPMAANPRQHAQQQATGYQQPDDDFDNQDIPF